jgi:predicted glycosyltransferase
MKKIFFYSQHLLGIGHLLRSAKLCEGLGSDYDVTLFNGGSEVPHIEKGSFKLINLPPLSAREDFKELYSPEGKNLSDVWPMRNKILTDSLAPECLIIELFPFGRSLFEKEILAFINYYKIQKPSLVVICSLRDILVDQINEHITAIIKEYFDYILVHSDSEVMKNPLLLEAESCLKGTTTQVCETGYITVNRPLAVKKDQIIVSIGGGAIGFELLQAMNEASFSQEVILVGGPQIPKEIAEKLCQNLRKNVRYIGVCPDLPSLIAESSLSVSTGGYNTVLESVAVNTYSLIYPLKHNSEQLQRAEAFKQLGLCEILHDAKDIKKQVDECFPRALPVPVPLRLDGVKSTLAFINEVL